MTPAQHSGTYFLSRKTKPQATRAKDGTFALTLLVLDRIGPALGEVESYLLTWSGPTANAFWDMHSAELVPGAALQITYEKQRLVISTGRHVQAQILGAVKSLQVLPKVANHCKTSTPKQPADHAASGLAAIY